MIKIFISYRRADSRKDAGRIYDRLIEAFGKEAIFKDVDSIPPGKDFRGILREAVAQCDVELVIIGQKWLNITSEDGKRRLDNMGDFVRIEVESGLQRDSCLVVPVRVDNAPMPSADDLPMVLRELAFKNARQVRDDPDFHADVSKIIRELQVEYNINPVKSQTKRKVEAPSFDVFEAIKSYYVSRKETDWETCRSLLAEIRESGEADGLFSIEAQENYIWQEIEREEAEKRYAIVRLTYEHDSLKQTWEALNVFWQDFPEYDPDNIAEKARPQAKPKPRKAVSEVSKPISEPVVATSDDETFDSMTPEKMTEWMESLTRSQAKLKPVKATPPQVKTNSVTASADAIRAIIGKPFDLCEIPAGDFLYGSTKRNMTLPAFAMAKYPITYSQYQVFVDAKDGLKDRRWWQGLAKSINELGSQKWKITEYPRENVSWYDALAFCRWLSWKLETLTPNPSPSGRGTFDMMNIDTWAVRLPTEFEWEKAARGTEGLIYPYGNKFDKNKSNTRESGIKQTTPVTQYPQGASPYGVLDMSGNVWEWCLTDYDNPAEHLSQENIGSTSGRVLRGGAWLSYDHNARAASRNLNSPSLRHFSIGFRVVHPLSL